jgi:hypothetical protein
MATADKTRQQLLDSMRKSKSGAAGKPAASKPAADKPAASKPAASGTRATAAKRTSPRRAAAKPATQKHPPSAVADIPAVTQQISNDPYHSSGRIWPD